MSFLSMKIGVTVKKLLSSYLIFPNWKFMKLNQQKDSLSKYNK